MPTGTPLIRIANISENKIDLSSCVFIQEKVDDRFTISYGDLLIAMSGATTGKMGVYLHKDKALLNQRVGNLKIINLDSLLPEYRNYFMQSKVNEILKRAYGGAQPNISSSNICDIDFLLPPLKEQHHIVEKVKYWFALIDIIESGKDDLQETIKQAKSKILDLAIHGKLVPQDPTDEPASELLKRINPKAEIACDNPHYRKLPKGWAVCCLEDIAEIFDNLRKPINSNERNSRIANKHKDELYPYYGATGQVGLIDAYLIDGTYLLLGEDGAPFLDKSAVKAYPIEGKCWVNNHAHILKPLCDFDYLMFYLNQVDYKDYVNGSTRLKLTQSDMRSILVLLPPIAEQKRISAKVRALFDLLDSIVYHL